MDFVFCVQSQRMRTMTLVNTWLKQQWLTAHGFCDQPRWLECWKYKQTHQHTVRGKPTLKVAQEQVGPQSLVMVC